MTGLSQVPAISLSSICALALVLYHTVPFAIQPSSRRHGFCAQCPPTCLSWWSQLLTLVTPLYLAPLFSTYHRLDTSSTGGVRRLSECRVVPSRLSSSGARAGCLVRCDSCHVMSCCIGLSARACGLIALQCTLCAFVPTLAHL